MPKMDADFLKFLKSNPRFFRNFTSLMRANPRIKEHPSLKKMKDLYEEIAKKKKEVLSERAKD